MAFDQGCQGFKLMAWQECFRIHSADLRIGKSPNEIGPDAIRL
jgi:hypothetical protein